jgi:hypothetical protein
MRSHTDQRTPRMGAVANAVATRRSSVLRTAQVTEKLSHMRIQPVKYPLVK